MNRKKRVLIIRAGLLGDTIWATTAIAAIRASLGPEVEIDVLIKQGMAGLFLSDPGIAKIVEIRKRKLPFFLSGPKMAVAWRSWFTPYDIAIDLETGTHFRSLMLVLAARRKIQARQLRDAAANGVEHIVVAMRRVIARCVSPEIADAAAPNLAIPAARPSFTPARDTKKIICIHLGNSWLAAGRTERRSWPARHWRFLLEHWPEWFPDHQVVVIGQPAESALAATLVDGLPHVRNICGQTNLQQLMEVLDESALLVTTDTGPSHMAAALGCPVVALFGPTDARETAPFAAGNNHVDVLSLALPCSPCVRTELFHTCPRNACMHAGYVAGACGAGNTQRPGNRFVPLLPLKSAATSRI